MRDLTSLIEKLKINKIHSLNNTIISNIQFDSRKCSKNTLFVALRGVQADGHNYIDSAISLGASVVVCEALPNNVHEYSQITFIEVNNSRVALAELAHSWHLHPAKSMNIIGITGTNGKTTITFILKSIFEQMGKKIGIIGTTGIYYGDQFEQATHTTPESLELSQILANMRDANIEIVIMEVSSHALCQHRADAIDFKAAIFTNLTHEHLDYHNTLKEYASAKKILFNKLGSDAIAIVNGDDEQANYMLQDIDAGKKMSFGRSQNASFIISDERHNIDITSFSLAIADTSITISTKLLGSFNIENLAAAASLCIGLGISHTKLQKYLSQAEGAPGRMERILLKNGAIALVDYAHTPDALQKALKASQEVLKASQHKGNKLISVFGCGGDRDISKRPIMGQISTEVADFSIITDDNPRTEDPSTILVQIEGGIEEKNSSKYQLVHDRRKAIAAAVHMSEKNDIILLAGKGHEDYQVIGTTKHHFDDKEELERFT